MVKTFVVIIVIAIAFILIAENPVQAKNENDESLVGIMRSIIDVIRNFIDNLLSGKTVDKNLKPRGQKWLSF